MPSLSPPKAPDPPFAELLADRPYRHVRKLGRGGMGEVHVVEYGPTGGLFRLPGVQFALKILRPEFLGDAELAARMQREAVSLGQLHHPNIVEVIDFWISRSGWPCLVMELLDGKTVGKALAEKHRLPAEDAVRIALEAASALSAAHAVGVIHRDITPGNLFLQEMRGYEPKLKVLDFGIARQLRNEDAPPDSLGIRTATGALVGSPAFMSPEASRGEPVDHRADLFSLGVVLYTMLVGHGPFDSLRVYPPSHYYPELSSLDEVAIRAIDDDKEKRYQSADEFRLDLSRLLKAVKSRAKRA